MLNVISNKAGDEIPKWFPMLGNAGAIIDDETGETNVYKATYKPH